MNSPPRFSIENYQPRTAIGNFATRDSDGKRIEGRSVPKPRPLVVGLVGGIGSGKSYVARLFRGAGAVVIDADRIVHRILGRPAAARTLARWWGREILNRRGTVDREAVGRRVFANKMDLRRLIDYLHPRVRREMLRGIARCRRKVVILDVPLLVETGMQSLCDHVVFVDSPRTTRLRRVRRDRRWSAAEVARRERFQFPLRQKRAVADCILKNSGNIRAQVRALYSSFVHDFSGE